MRTTDEWDPTCEWSEEEVQWYLMGPFEGGVPGLVRRVRRILDVSQRGLAALIGVSQSVVARWETGRTSPRVSVVQQLFRLAGLRAAVHDDSGEVVEPMRDDGARDRADRRYPAHVDLTVTGWYVPRGLSWCTAEPGRWLRRSRALEEPYVRHHTSAYLRRLQRSVFGMPVDHPALGQLVAEAVHLEEVRAARFEQSRAA